MDNNTDNQGTRLISEVMTKGSSLKKIDEFLRDMPTALKTHIADYDESHIELYEKGQFTTAYSNRRQEYNVRIGIGIYGMTIAEFETQATIKLAEAVIATKRLIDIDCSGLKPYEKTIDIVRKNNYKALAYPYEEYMSRCNEIETNIINALTEAYGSEFVESYIRKCCECANDIASFTN